MKVWIVEEGEYVEDRDIDDIFLSLESAKKYVESYDPNIVWSIDWKDGWKAGLLERSGKRSGWPVYYYITEWDVKE